VEAGGNAQSVVAPELTQVTRSEICFFTHRQQQFIKFTEMIKMLKNFLCSVKKMESRFKFHMNFMRILTIQH
jgi:hypothetical protein